jgi:translation initiation factor IF-1
MVRSRGAMKAIRTTPCRKVDPGRQGRPPRKRYGNSGGPSPYLDEGISIRVRARTLPPGTASLPGEGLIMSKEDLLEADGVVTALLPNLMARVLLDNGQEILATSSGRLRRNRIRLLVGDRVTVEMTPYDLSRGRVNFRHKQESSAASPPARSGPMRRRR